jgi:V8-like Glu-specific endopeptidase
MHHRLIALSFFVIGCGSSATVSADDVLATADWEIVGGSRGPTVVSLSARQRLAVGAVLDASDDSWDNFCTGTLINPNLVITAGHCVEGYRRAELAFAIGGDAENPVESQSPSAIYLHPDYDPDGDAEYDVAVLRFSQPFTLADPIPANCDAVPAVGARVQVAGYGETASDEYNTRQWWAPVRVSAHSRFDLVVQGNGAGGCHGDSGGPLLAASGGVVSLRGTLSWGDDCGERDHYSRLDAHCPFFRTVPGFTAPATAAAPTTAQSGETTVEGVRFSAAQVIKVLALVNSATVSKLDDEVGLDARAAQNLVANRPYSSLAAVGAVAYVGPVALALLRDAVGP